MNTRKILFGTSLTLILTVALASPGFSQAQPAQPAQNRIAQQIVVNGQPANGAYVQIAGGGMQSYKCPNPQAYNTPDGASSGWACYDQATATYLLNSLPPVQQQVQPQVQAQPQTVPDAAPTQQPTVVYQQPAPAVVYAPSPYPYAYPYPYYYSPLYFGVGIGGFYGGGFYGGFRGGFGGRGFRR